MKKVLLKTLDVILTIIMIVSAIYAVFNMVMGWMPVEIQAKVYGWLHMSQEYIATFSISATINAVVLVASKLLQTSSRIALTSKLSANEQVMNNSIDANEQVVARMNSLITNMKILQETTKAIMAAQKVTVERNINASEKLVHKAEKDAYKLALDTMEEAQKKIQELSNIISVYERTEVKEVVVEKPDDSLSGRV